MFSRADLLAASLFGFLALAACQPPNSSGGLTQQFSAEMPVTGSIVFSSK